MDRFERGFDLSEYSLTEVHLHSNMDRFEREGQRVYFFKSVIDLHSNMDRFERPSRQTENRPSRQIYIPIWIDLKVLALAFARI